MHSVNHKGKHKGRMKALIQYNIKRCLEQVGCKDVTYVFSSGTHQVPVIRYCGDCNKTLDNV